MQTIIKKLSVLEQALRHRIRGQDEVLSRLFRAIKRRELKTVPQRGPRGAFFFAGPTGVGKTETAKVVTEVLFGADSFLRIDCSEFKTLASMEGLLGNRAGDRGRLGQAYDHTPNGVWLWDEIEKAHPELVQLFLQMADEARVTLACGETLDLRNLYIIVTSNLGSAEIIGREYLTFTSLERHVVNAIEQFLRPELLGRFGKPFVFRPLGREVQTQITGQRLDDLLAWELEQGWQLKVHPEVLPFLIHRGFSPRLGARPLLGFIEEMVGDAVAESLWNGGAGAGQLIVNGERLEVAP
jgi:ATP-dependent Clp protease ATP-binding subunit ClpA